MATEEINTFIETMKELGDIWTVNQVKDVFGDNSLEDAINDRKVSHAQLGSLIGIILNR